ncbi:hypothetical protein G6F57_021584 [Rhizopus arrhizus]|nr:hypothetical protein G6F57_021584 [Rhizopus arrhizus]KAG1581934.1 hypothetical protein G6F46_015294 [Rhizopus delemar]
MAFGAGIQCKCCAFRQMPATPRMGAGRHVASRTFRRPDRVAHEFFPASLRPLVIARHGLPVSVDVAAGAGRQRCQRRLADAGASLRCAVSRSPMGRWAI